MKQRLIVGISGASGAIYGIRLLEILQNLTEIDTHLIISKAAKRTIVLETDYKIDQVERLADEVFPDHDIAASVSSGSYQTSGMAVIPCSIKTVTPGPYATDDSFDRNRCNTSSRYARLLSSTLYN